MRLRLLYASVAPVEELLVYHVCPGGAAARLVAAGAPWRCGRCRWRELVDPAGLLVREAGVELLDRLALARPDALLLDGPEPLVAAGPGAYELPRAVGERLGSVEAVGFHTMGLVGPEGVRRAAEAGFDFALFEYVLHLERPPWVERVTGALEEAYRRLPVLEIVMIHDGSREATVAAAGLASRYPEAGLHLVAAGEGVEDRVYEAAEKLRERHGVNVYPHPEESYTLTDTLCRSCGAPLVERKPWGVRVHAEPLEEGRRGARCPRCGAEARLLLCRGRGAPRALHREVVVW